MKFLNNIKKKSLLQHIPRKILEDYLSKDLIKVKKFKKNEVIHFDGDPCKGLEVILEGKVVVERIDENGDLFTITELSTDDILGGNIVFAIDSYYPMTISALTDVNILEIGKDTLLDLCCENRAFLSNFLQVISVNTLILGNKIKYYANRSIRESICAYLKQEYHLQKSYNIKLDITKKALAEKIGVQRTSLSRELQKMKSEGLIDYDAKSIIILDSATIR